MNFLELATTRYTTKSYQDKRIEKRPLKRLRKYSVYLLLLSIASLGSFSL